MNIKQCCISGSLCFLLAACSMMSPEYKTPNVDTPSQWTNFSSTHLAQEKNIEYMAWWQKFNDPTLNQLIKDGLANNNSIGQAQGNLEQAQGQLKAVELSWIPSLSFLGGYSNNPALGDPQGFYGLWPQYSMFNIFNTIAITKSAKLKVAAQEQAIAATKLVLIGQIANSYYTLIAQIEQLKLYVQYQKDLNEILEIQKTNYQDGLNSDIDVESIAQKMNQAVVQQKVIENNITNSQNALRYLINQNPGKIATKIKFSQVNTHYPNVATLPVTVLANRPDVAIAELQYHLSVQNVGGAQTELLPSVQLDMFKGAADVGAPQFFGQRTSIYDAYLVWAINPSIFGQIDALKGAEKVAYYNYIDTVRKALRDVDNDLVNHDMANQRYIATHKAYNNANQQYVLTLGLYKTGIDSYLTVLREKLNVDQAAIEVNQMKLMQMVTLVNLYQDLGGGSRL
ncbi:MAG: TolC family protein [Pseudomonadota bacterium]